MTRRVSILLIGVLGAVVVLAVGKAVLFRASKGGDIGTPSTGALLPLPVGVRLVAERTFTAESNLGGGIRLLVLDGDGGPQGGSGLAESYLVSLDTRGWRRASRSGALSPDRSICLTATATVDYVADSLRSDDTRQFLRELEGDRDRTAVVSATFC